jgi:hypothetical protein
VKKEALESGIEEAMRDKEAAMAEIAAHQAKCLQHEAEVRGMVQLIGGLVHVEPGQLQRGLVAPGEPDTGPCRAQLACAAAPAWTTKQLQAAEGAAGVCAVVCSRLSQ